MLRRGNVEEPASLDPIVSSDVHSSNILFDLYEGLVAVDARGRVVAGTAASWNISDDGLTYAFELRPGARWSNVELDKREWKYFLETRDARDEWQVMRFSWFGDYDDPSTFTDIFHSASTQNLARYKNDHYDSLLESAESEVDLAKRAEILADAETILLEDYPIVPMYFFVSKHMVKVGVLGFEDNVLNRHPSRYLRVQ